VEKLIALAARMQKTERRLWAKQEEEVVIKNYGHMPLTDIANHLRRTISVIENKVRRLKSDMASLRFP